MLSGTNERERPRKVRPKKESETNQTDKAAVKEEDKTDAGATGQSGEITPMAAVVALNTPIAAVLPSSLVETEVAIDVVAGQPQAAPRAPSLSKGVAAVDPEIVSDTVVKGPFDLRAGGAHQSHAQMLVDAGGKPSQGVATDLGAEINAPLTSAHYAARSETAPIQSTSPLLGTLAPNGAPAQTAPAVLSLHTPVGTPGWAGELASKITYLVGTKMQSPSCT
jgi:hypothetical protein